VRWTDDGGFQVYDAMTADMVADALDPWLHAAGYERVEALDEIDC
jgi:hypothetical protein